MTESSKPLITVITVTYNSAASIMDTLESVARQDYPNIEHLIIDGLSKDGTIALVEAFAKKTTKTLRWISEKDSGIYNAMNKGMRNAAGKYLGFLNSDDFYAADDIISSIVEAFEREQADIVYGDLLYVKQQDTSKVVRTWRTRPFYKGAFTRGWHPPHPAFYIKTELYARYGGFKEHMRISADFEMMLRYMETLPLKSTYVEKFFVRMRMGGHSHKFLNYFKSNIENMQAFQYNKLPVPLLLWPTRFTRKIREYF